MHYDFYACIAALFTSCRASCLPTYSWTNNINRIAATFYCCEAFAIGGPSTALRVSLPQVVLGGPTVAIPSAAGGPIGGPTVAIPSAAGAWS